MSEMKENYGTVLALAAQREAQANEELTRLRAENAALKAKLEEAKKFLVESDDVLDNYEVSEHSYMRTVIRRWLEGQ